MKRKKTTLPRLPKVEVGTPRQKDARRKRPPSALPVVLSGGRDASTQTETSSRSSLKLPDVPSTLRGVTSRQSRSRRLAARKPQALSLTKLPACSTQLPPISPERRVPGEKPVPLTAPRPWNKWARDREPNAPKPCDSPISWMGAFMLNTDGRLKSIRYYILNTAF